MEIVDAKFRARRCPVRYLNTRKIKSGVAGLLTYRARERICLIEGFENRGQAVELPSRQLLDYSGMIDIHIL